jgi:Uma2 family endonuclease
MAIVTDWTLEEFLRLPETKPALEFENGVVTQKVSPTTEHSVLQKHVVKLLDALEVGQAFPELRTVLPMASKVPDVAFYVTAELPISPTRRWLRYPEWAPTVAIEIASPDQELDELRDKCHFYVREGSKLALLVLPETQRIELVPASVDRPARPRPRRAVYSGDAPIHELIAVLGARPTAITPAAIFAVLRP